MSGSLADLHYVGLAWIMVLHSGDTGVKLMLDGSDLERVKRGRLVSLLVLATILLLLVAQFGPSAIFGTEARGDHHAPAGGHLSNKVGSRTTGTSS
jgi:hypothetical protein